MADVRRALREQLEARGFEVADDTVAARNELYVKGEGDLAAGMFEFKRDVGEAADSMYQGHWTEGLPPRFAVLPAQCASDPYFEVLEQMRILPLLYELSGEEVVFIDLDAALARLKR